MGSFKPPKNSFSPEELEFMDLALHVAWAKLSADIRDPWRTKAMQSLLVRKIIQIAKTGVTDPGVMSGLALDQMHLLNAAHEKRKCRPN